MLKATNSPAMRVVFIEGDIGGNRATRGRIGEEVGKEENLP